MRKVCWMLVLSAAACAPSGDDGVQTLTATQYAACNSACENLAACGDTDLGCMSRCARRVVDHMDCVLCRGLADDCERLENGCADVCRPDRDGGEGGAGAAGSGGDTGTAGSGAGTGGAGGGETGVGGGNTGTGGAGGSATGAGGSSSGAGGNGSGWGGSGSGAGGFIDVGCTTHADCPAGMICNSDGTCG